MNRYFADVSNNNPQDIDWTQYRKGQHVLVGEKASEGTKFIDKTQPRRSDGAHKAGIWVIHYHFAHVGDSPTAQARFFWDLIQKHFARLDFACVDIEAGGLDGHSPAEAAIWLKAFDISWRRYTGHSLIGYSNEALLREIVRAGGHIAGDRWWIAAYGPDKPRIGGVRTWAWQYTDGVIGPQPHTAPGIGRCDMSMLNAATYARLRLSRPKP